VNENEITIKLLLKIKFTFLDLKLAETALQKLSLGDRETIRPCGATEHDLDDREATPDQGGSVVPDVETAHKVIRPETH
jgi:hypothetical protein